MKIFKYEMLDRVITAFGTGSIVERNCNQTLSDKQIFYTVECLNCQGDISRICCREDEILDRVRD